MIIQVPIGYEEVTLVVKVYTSKPVTIRLKVIDVYQPNTTFTDRNKMVDGESIFFVRMPVSAKDVFVYVYNEANGNLKQGQDNSFELISVSKEILEKKLDVIDFANPLVKSFVEFCTIFAYNAGSMQTGTYVSADRKFVIKYFETISDNGQEQTTPARIELDTGVIEVSQKKFLPFSIPNRMAILLHEFSHVYLNDNCDDEVEADLNGLLIYLGLGYPRIEAFEVFAKTFVDAPTEGNKVRYDRIVSFIDNFENYNTVMYE